MQDFSAKAMWKKKPNNIIDEYRILSTVSLLADSNIQERLHLRTFVAVMLLRGSGSYQHFVLLEMLRLSMRRPGFQKGLLSLYFIHFTSFWISSKPINLVLQGLDCWKNSVISYTVVFLGWQIVTPDKFSYI